MAVNVYEILHYINHFHIVIGTGITLVTLQPSHQVLISWLVKDSKLPCCPAHLRIQNHQYSRATIGTSRLLFLLVFVLEHLIVLFLVAYTETNSSFFQWPEPT